MNPDRRARRRQLQSAAAAAAKHQRDARVISAQRIRAAGDSPRASVGVDRQPSVDTIAPRGSARARAAHQVAGVDGRSGQLEPVGDLLRIDYTDRRPRRQLEQLMALEQQLAELVSTSAPNAWRAMRRTIRRLLRNARQELRTATIASERGS